MSSSSNNKATLSKSFPMNGGHGKYSYSKNSSYQREAAMIVKAMINDAIAENLDLENLPLTSNTFCIADLGCSIGPNTYISMKNVLDAVHNKYESKSHVSHQLPEFQVFFNDHSTNDFNTLFASLPPEKHYFAAGVPGSFHGRLFPKSTLQIVHSSYALQWLSEVPKEVLDRDSLAWNKGKIYHTSACDEVANAYAAQFAKDIDNFLNFRAKEIVVGGMMIIAMPVIQDGVHRSQSAAGWVYDCLGSSLVDMADEGMISKAQVDAFNLPIYTSSAKEMVGLVERNGCFSIEKVKLADPIDRIDEPLDMKVCTKHIRAAVEGIIKKHFGSSSEIMDEIFDRFAQKAAMYSLIDSSYKKGTLLFLALKRN